ncbi:unnamed protein product, partial [Heterosigma akashiwo]
IQVLVLTSGLALLVVVHLTDVYYGAFLEFWAVQLPRAAVLWGVFAAGGLVCRRYCPVDARGYILTQRHSWFKVNYTHKACVLAAYLVPLALPPPPRRGVGPGLALLLDLWTVLFALAALVQPLRERWAPLMLMFNALDRPEDRPHSLEWAVALNLLPGFLAVLAFQQVFALTGQRDLLY